jgi:hypothetical protein
LISELGVYAAKRRPSDSVMLYGDACSHWRSDFSASALSVMF